MKKLTVHLISDSSGQTVKHAASTALAKFSDIEIKQYHWPMIRNQQLLNDALIKIREKPGIILYTISEESIRKKLKKFCIEMKIPCISVVSRIVNAISEYVGVGVDMSPLYSNKFDQSYFNKLEAIDYTLHHDDGQLIDELEEADIILIGPSRTSKTPTSVYLAYNGFKTANVPFIHGVPFPDFLKNIKNPVVFGLIINPGRLIEIRESRMNLLQASNDSYTDIKIIQEECRQVRDLCNKNNGKIVDVTRRSIEETAAIIMKLYYEHKQKRY